MALDFGAMDLRDALDLVILMEEEARERYAGFSRLVGGRYPGDADATFAAMAGFEAKHGEQLRARRRALFHDAPARVRAEDLDDAEAPDRGAPRGFMSPSDAVAVAIAAEEKAFRFFDEALPHVRDPEVRALFAELREEEVDHRRLLLERAGRLPPGPDLAEEEADPPGSDPG